MLSWRMDVFSKMRVSVPAEIYFDKTPGASSRLSTDTTEPASSGSIVYRLHFGLFSTGYSIAISLVSRIIIAPRKMKCKILTPLCYNKRKNHRLGVTQDVENYGRKI